MLSTSRFSPQFKLSAGLLAGELLLFVGQYGQRLLGPPRVVELVASLSAVALIVGSFIYFGRTRSGESKVRKTERPVLAAFAVVMLTTGGYALSHLTPIPGTGH